nr:retrovirus-related Pol polyprotein from transposon TNT 1-94 [Tanacetum cinerariifolium]
VVVQNVQGRQNRVLRNNTRGAVAARNRGVQNIVGNANLGGQANTFDDDVDKAPVQGLSLNEDNIFQVDQCDAFDSDVDDAPTAQTIGLKTSNFDQLYAYLKQHETHANENKMMLKRYTQHAIDPLALVPNVSPHQYPSKSLAIPQSAYVPPVNYQP